MKAILFTATWCAPCKRLKPHVQKLVDQGYQIDFVDIDENPDLASQYSIASVPQVVLESGERLLNPTPMQIKSALS